MSDRLLVVDDETGFCELVARIARSCGFEVEQVTDTQVLFERYDSFQPSVIVTDLQMPGLDGMELLERLALRGCTASLVIMSGMDRRVVASARSYAEENGLKVADAITKPVRIEALRTLLESLRFDSGTISVADIVAALDNDEFFLVYQPQISLASGRLVGFEALVRWRHKGVEILPPDRFLTVVETNDIVGPFTDRVAELAVREASQLATLDGSTTVAFNVSVANLRDMQLPDRVATICGRAGLPTSNIEIEVTETLAMDDASHAAHVLTRLRLKGFELGLDDFGIGHSSLTRLQKLPFRKIKIDKSFVRICDRDDDSLAIVHAVIGLGHALGLTVVAEGVETAEVFRAVRNTSCDLAQGFAIAQPMAAEALPDWIRDWPDTWRRLAG